MSEKITLPPLSYTGWGATEHLLVALKCFN